MHTAPLTRNTADKMLVLAFLAFALIANAASANIIVYDNDVPPPSVDSLALSDTRVALFNFDNYLRVDDFELDSAATLSGLRWWGANFFGADDRFLITLYEDSAGFPGLGIASLVFNAVASSPSPYVLGGFAPILEYEIAMPDINLMAQTRYWLGVQSVAQGGWGWAPSRNAGTALYNVNGGSWLNGTSNAAFQLLGRATVPVPGTILLLLAGLAGVGAIRSRTAR